MSSWMKYAMRGALLVPLVGSAGLGAHAQEASAVSAYVDSSYLFLIGGLIVMFMAAGFLCLESGLVRSKNASMQSLKNVS
ncbi:MAG: ammonium transporter, partial [Pseudomonadota bacterium]